MSVERSGRHVYINEHTGHQTTPFQRRNEMASDGLGAAAYLGNSVVQFCPVCMGPMFHNGSSIDHIVSIDQLKADLGWSAEKAAENVGHESNQLVSCSGCNSSKKQKDLFEWWRSDLSKTYMDPSRREKVLAVLDILATHHGKTRVTHLPFGEYKTVVLQVQKHALG
jgi:hypothetical protein